MCRPLGAAMEPIAVEAHALLAFPPHSLLCARTRLRLRSGQGNPYRAQAFRSVLPATL